MADNRLFRWNARAGLICGQCQGAVFLEEIASQEIFCSFCGYIWASNRDDWPADWDRYAVYGVGADEKREEDAERVRQRMEDIVRDGASSEDGGIGAKETVPESPPSLSATTTNPPTQTDECTTTLEILDVIVVQKRPPPPEIARSISRPPSVPDSLPSPIAEPVAIPQVPYKTPPPSTSSRTNTPPTPVTPPLSAEQPVPVSNPRPPRSTKPPTSGLDNPRQIGTTPLLSVDVDLLAMARQFDLSEEAVIAAKHIVLRYESKFPRSQLAVLARAALFAACRQLGIAKTFKEFDQDFEWNKKTLWHRAFKTIDSLLKTDAHAADPLGEMSPPHGSTGPDNTANTANATSCQFVPSAQILPTVRVADFIASESKALFLSARVRSRALAISQHPAVDMLFSGKRPSATAAIILSFAAECEEVYLGSAPYAKAANVSTQAVAAGQKSLLQCVEEMAGRGPLPKAFRARWNTAGYTVEEDEEDYGEGDGST